MPYQNLAAECCLYWEHIFLYVKPKKTGFCPCFCHRETGWDWISHLGVLSWLLILRFSFSQCLILRQFRWSFYFTSKQGQFCVWTWPVLLTMMEAMYLGNTWGCSESWENSLVMVHWLQRFRKPGARKFPPHGSEICPLKLVAVLNTQLVFLRQLRVQHFWTWRLILRDVVKCGTSWDWQYFACEETVFLFMAQSK